MGKHANFKERELILHHLGNGKTQREISEIMNKPRSTIQHIIERKPNQALKTSNINKTVKHGGGRVCVWGCISSAGTGNLKFIEGNMDATMYLNILKENLASSEEKLGIDYQLIKPNKISNLSENYTITPERLRQIRSEFLYWFFDEPDETSDYERSIHSSQKTLHKNLHFKLPFFGFRYNYTRISLDGYLGFSDFPKHLMYPLVFPTKDWPKNNDPSFIGIFLSKCRIGRIYPSDTDQRMPGVYFRIESNLNKRTDRMGVEMRERTMWDIREGIIGAKTFVPNHVIIATWKNISFSGGIDNSLFRTNTFQMIIATDEIYTYAIFNYAQIEWDSHTEAGGSVDVGKNGVPAFVGFNAGNSTRSFTYKPYSQSTAIENLTKEGWGNGFPGRHIFRIDEKITLGACANVESLYYPSTMPLTFSPESGIMLGGNIVNITGPCFDPSHRITCYFDTEMVPGFIINRYRAFCIQPALKVTGYINLRVSVNNNVQRRWIGKYFVEAPSMATENIYFSNNNIFTKSPEEIQIKWYPSNLATNANSIVQISIWGYYEIGNHRHLTFVDVIESSAPNTGEYTITPKDFRSRNNFEHSHIEFGFIQINTTNSIFTPTFWSRPIPLAWYFNPQWERMYGTDWASYLCNKWFQFERPDGYFLDELPLCPCKLENATFNKGQFLPDLTCDKDSNPTCFFNSQAVHCVKSGQPSLHYGSEQQCCYNNAGELLSFYDTMYGSRPKYSHDIGKGLTCDNRQIPTLSQWYNDNRPYFSCCYWQNNNKSNDCKRLRFERRPSQHCSKYKPPIVASILLNSTIQTINNKVYKLNSLGEYVLAKGKINNNQFEVQGRFQTIGKGNNETCLTSIAITNGNKNNNIEVKIRPPHAQWRYKLNVYAGGNLIYFDRPNMKFQYFDGTTVYTPTYNLNQSEVIIMHSSGVGVHIIENSGQMKSKIYIPESFKDEILGLVGIYNSDDPKNKIEELKRNFLVTKDDYLFVSEYGKTLGSYNSLPSYSFL
ncbi:protein mesh-like [Condylostylus longicornis]|uniref:protein mesh-like n=1 Tax=Condylostylus longicornis TaxID=2530218 RepID=UPI00244DE6B5|nr:protein mesh-like [Condylostylus longicornis]